MAVTYSLSLTIRNDAITFGQVNEWIAEQRIANTWHVAAEVEVELQNGSHKTNLQLSTKAIIWKWPTQFATNIYQLYSVGYLLCPAPPLPFPLTLGKCWKLQSTAHFVWLGIGCCELLAMFAFGFNCAAKLPEPKSTQRRVAFFTHQTCCALEGKIPYKKRGSTFIFMFIRENKKYILDFCQLVSFAEI